MTTPGVAVSLRSTLRAQFAQKDGEYFNATMFGKGLDQLRKAYGQYGFIDFVGNPVPRVDEAKRKELEQNVLKTFYLTNISSPTELQA